LNITFFNTYHLDSIPDFNTDNIDVAISANYVNIISSKFIRRFKLGILNIHGGDLPRYRGNACQAWAILNKEKYIAVCIHKMLGGELDSGDILTKAKIKINLNTRIAQIYERIEEIAPDLFINTLKKLSKNNNFILEKQSNNKKDILRCYPRKPEDAKINFNLKNKKIIRLINASSEPYSGAFCFYKTKRMTIWKAELYKNENFLAIPGQVCQIIGNKYAVICCKKGKIIIKEVEYEGIRTYPAHFIKSLRDRLN